MILRDFARYLTMGTAAALVLAAAGTAQAANDHATVQGTVKNAQGQPVSGAFVRLRNPAQRLTFMVVSQDKGMFTASDLPAGQYTVQGVGGEFQSAVSQPVSVAVNGVAKTDVSLSVQRGPSLTPAWPERVPEAMVDKTPKEATALPAGDTKQLVSEKCTVCHDVQRILGKRSPADDWQFTVKRMQGMAAGAITDADVTQVVKYVTAAFPSAGSVDPNSRLPNYAMTGQSMKYRVVTLDLPKRFSEPHDIASDPKGVAWAAERAGSLIRFDPKSYDFTEVHVPPGPTPPGPTPTPKPHAFHGNVAINASTAKMRMVQVAEEIITVLAADPNAEVKVSVEIQVNFPSGASDQTKRAVTENAQTLNFKNADWE